MIAVLAWLGTIVEAYLLGGIDTGIIVSSRVYQDDVRTHGSGGAGMTNMLRTFGKKAAFVTALGDGLKGFAAVLLGRWFFSLAAGAGAPFCVPLWGAYLASLCAVLGHWRPLFFGFRGGKGVMVAAGGIIALRPVFVPFLLAIFLAFFLPTRMVSLGSIMMAISYPIMTALYSVFWLHLGGADLAVSIGVSALIGGLILYMHRANIGRIRAGTEYRFDGKNKKQ